MRRTVGRAVFLVLLAASASAKTFVVTKTGDSGKGTLRWAITQANTRPSDDQIVFDPMTMGQTIRPLTSLPRLTDPGTDISGDINADGIPDIELRGSRATGTGNALEIRHFTSNGCTIRGLAITDWDKHGVAVFQSNYNEIMGCSFGVRLDGTTLARNGGVNIRLDGARHNRIGAPAAIDRNVFGGTAGTSSCVSLRFGAGRNRIQGNYFGVKRDGSGILYAGYVLKGIYLLPDCQDNMIGGSGAGEGNVFSGYHTGVCISGAQSSRNFVEGNIFGLLPDGNTQALIARKCVWLSSGAHDNTIGGTTAGARNVFSGNDVGIEIASAGTDDNTVDGNYFGLNAAGTAARRMRQGVRIRDGAGTQTIGGSPSAGGNYFSLGGVPGNTFGVDIQGCGNDTVVRGNKFGIRPDGGWGTRHNYSIQVYGARAEVLDNQIARASTGLSVLGAADVTALRNVFKRCDRAVYLLDASRCLLGNLGNADTTDDGGNNFKASNTWTVDNRTTYKVKAEGNRWPGTTAVVIDATIYDKRDNPAYGRVDYDPLKNGVVPSGGAIAAAGLSATPTGLGAQLTFTLSSAATVSARVLSIAGRPVKTICAAKDCESGTNTLIWNAMSDQGLRAPGGVYLIEITASGNGGSQATALTQVRLNR